MLETFSFALPPDQFHRVVRQDVPERSPESDFLNLDGQAVRFAHFAEDMTSDYAELWSRYGAWSA